MDEYRVRYWELDGNEKYIGFRTIKQAQLFYDSVNGMAEIQKYVEERHEYEDVMYPEFEF